MIKEGHKAQGSRCKGKANSVNSYALCHESLALAHTLNLVLKTRSRASLRVRLGKYKL